MRGRKATLIVLSEREQADLETLVRRHRTPQQLAQRARVVLAAAAGQTNDTIAAHLGRPVDFVSRWRRHWAALQGVSLDDLPVDARLADTPRPGRPATITPDQVCQIVALACEAPSTSGRPISQWSAKELADEIVRRGILPRISPRHAARLLKKGISNRIRSGIG